MIKLLPKNNVIVKNTVFFNNIFSQSKGLMFTFKKKDTGYVFPFQFEQLIPITMFFVFYPIDVLWLDKNKKIVELKKNAPPFTPLIYPKKKAKYLVELPQGTITSFSLELNQKLVF